MDDEAKRPAEPRGPTPAGGFLAGLERAQAAFARLALAGLLFFVVALVPISGGREAAPFVGFLMVLFFALYVVSLVVTVFGRRRREPPGGPPSWEEGKGP